MFTGIVIACSAIAVMIGTIIMTCVKLFAHIRPFHFYEHRVTTISLFFMCAITITTLIESVMVYIRIFSEDDIQAFLFACLALIAFTSVFFITLPDVIPKKEGENRDTPSLACFGKLCVGIALFYEGLATVMFYFVWTHL